LRDATTTRDQEKYYGANNDALIAGLNVEITNKLTLARRYGNTLFDSATYSDVDRFYDFHLFGPISPYEQITVMIDQANALYSLYAPQSSAKKLVWTKSAGAGQTYMQGVGNTLYFGNGVDNKKWLQTLQLQNGQWAANWPLNTPTTPFLSTFIIDPNGNIQQLVATSVPVGSIFASADVVEVFTPVLPQPLFDILSAGDEVTFPGTLGGPAVMAATWLQGATVTVTQVGFAEFTFNFITTNYAQTAETGVYFTVYPGDGTPFTGTTQPAWSLAVPTAANLFKGGTTQDGTALWVNRGNPVENWGIANATTPIVPVVQEDVPSWAENTYYSPVSVIVDSNGNLQQVVKAGLSQTTGTPTWNQTLDGLTYDGIPATAVTWKMIQSAASLSWQPDFPYPTGSFLVETPVAGVASLFTLLPPTAPYINGPVSAFLWQAPHSSGGSFGVGTWDGVDPYNNANPANPPSGLPFGQTQPGSVNVGSVNNLTSFDFAISPTGGSGVFVWNTVDSSGNISGTTNPFPGAQPENLFIAITATIQFDAPGTYTIAAAHGDGMVLGMGGGAVCTAGSLAQNLAVAGTNTSLMGYPIFPFGSNLNVTANGDVRWNDTYTIQIPVAGPYPIEINLARWDKAQPGLAFTINGNTLPSSAPSGSGTSGSVEPTWPAFSTAFAPLYATVTESSGRLQWSNLGPVSDFAWLADKHFTLPNTYVIDASFDFEYPFGTGYTLTSAPTFSTTKYAVVDDPNYPGLSWINYGPSGIVPAGTITTSNGGWEYGISLVNTLDATYSNSSSLSAPTGDFTAAQGVFLAPGQGLPPIADIDPQSDYVAIWRTTDGQNTGFLIPGLNDYAIGVTIPLWQYLMFGYTDTTTDEELDNLITAPVLGEGTPPAAGAINLTYSYQRLWFSVNNVVQWTSGPDMPVGNGLNGVAPLNFDQQSALVKRLVPVTSGMYVFTVSDLNLIVGNGTSSNPFESAVPFLKGTGLSSYNALDVNGAIIGLFTTDSQFCIIDPANGLDTVSIPLADQFQENNGTPGQSWNPSTAYVAWYVNGQDQAWYISDGVNGWYRLIATPAPENGGYTWSPFAKIVSGVKALQSIEVTPGNHRLLLGPGGSGSILYRDRTTNADDGETYPASAVFGSFVLAQPGQIAMVPYIVTEETGFQGTGMTIGVLIDEALPGYPGPFDVLKHFKNDPPNLRPSMSIPAKRFYLSEDEDSAAAMRHMQIQVSWAEEDAANELLTMSIFGGYIQDE
jgi:hypothetical protein